MMFAAALLWLAGPASAPPPAVVPAPAASVVFAPPLDRPMRYRVTTRRLGRDGGLLGFSLLYDLQWQRAGRGYRLVATLRRIDSDAPPRAVRALTAVLQPLVGEAMTYLVAPDGDRIDLVDAERLWDRAMARTEALAAAADQPEAKQLAALVAALSPDERAALASADIRALLAPANAASRIGGTVAPDGDGARETVTKVEAGTAAAQPLVIDSLWTIDRATGLILREQRQSWIVGDGGAARTLVEERIRAIESDVS